MEKKVLAKLNKCYSVAPLLYHGEPHVLVAAEKQDRCILFDAAGNEKATVWEGPGGVMTMAQIPGSEGDFLATHKFYSPNDSKEAKIVLATPNADGTWAVKTLVDLPFVHRFDILQSGGKNYLIACTLKSGHEYKDDWSCPGKVYVAELPNDLTPYNDDNQLPLQVLKDNMLKNHGYYKVVEDGRESSLVCSENGVFRFFPPMDEEDWRVETLLTTPASDATMIDLDGDGEMEMAVLAPFHGDDIVFYKKKDGAYAPMYTYPEKAEFLHAIWSGELEGRPVTVLGHRKGARRLLEFWWDADKQSIAFKTLDDDCGPANAYGYKLGDKDILIAANRETDEVAMYIF